MCIMPLPVMQQLQLHRMGWAPFRAEKLEAESRELPVWAQLHAHPRRRSMLIDVCTGVWSMGGCWWLRGRQMGGGFKG